MANISCVWYWSGYVDEQLKSHRMGELPPPLISRVMLNTRREKGTHKTNDKKNRHNSQLRIVAIKPAKLFK